MRSFTRRAAVALLSLTLLSAACGGDDDEASDTDDSGDPGDGTVELVSADVERREPAADAPVDQLAAGMRELAARLAATQPDGNLVFSPTSIAVAFAMAEAGADDATAAQIAQVFGFPGQPAVHEAMNALTAQLDAANREGEDPTEQVILELANAVWGQRGLDFGAPFLDTLAGDYGTGVETVDFAGDPSASRDAVNAWVADVTRDRIPELVPDGMVTPETVVMLVNAIYLKAAWEVPFSEDSTSDQPFHLSDGQIVDVPTMVQSGLRTRAVTGSGYTAVEIPYTGGELSMLVVVPDGGSLADLEAGLDGAGWAEIAAGLQPAAVDLSLPRWDIGTTLDLGPAMTTLGLPIPGGDLSGIAPGVAIGAAVHAANITVNEAGTEAAAATAVAGITSAPGDVLTVRVDRPFLFVVQHVETGTPLFFGRITDPRS